MNSSQPFVLGFSIRSSFKFVILFAALALCGTAAAQEQTGFNYLLQHQSIPKWATTVCFIETFMDYSSSQTAPANFDWNMTDDGSDFLIYGPKGAFHIKSQDWFKGKATTELVWSRTRDTETASEFTSIVLPRRHQDGTAVTLLLKWGPPASYHEEWNSLASGQPLLRTSGRCHPIK